MARKFTVSMLTLAMAAGAYAQDAAAPDLAKDTVDPYNVGVQRARFLKAAGADNELDNSEFTANASAADGFVKSFDKWETVVKFDRDKSTTLNWFEASAYRDALRKAVMTEYDADKNKGLAGDERAKANAALASGKLPAIAGPSAAPAVATPAAPTTPGAPAAPGTPRTPGGFGGRGGQGGPGGGAFGGFDEATRAKFEAFNQEITKKHDKDGDGQLNREERQAAGPEYRQFFEKQMTERYDTNKDGQLDDAERQAIGEQFRQQGEQQRADFIKQNDKNGDGQLDDAERQAAFQQMRERRYDANGDGKLDDNERATMEQAQKEREQRIAEITKQYDKDGDGQLNDEERRAAGDAFRGQGGRQRRGGQNNPQ